MMYKNRVKKWVGMIFLLAICMTLNLDVDVFAANTECKTTNDAAIYYGVKHVESYDASGKLVSIKLTVENGEFYLKLLTKSQGKSKKPKAIFEDNSISIINSNKPLKKNKSYTITSAQLADYVGTDGRGEFYFSGYTEGKKSSSDPCGKKSYGFKFGVEGQEDAVSSGPVASVAFNTTVCQNARNLVNDIVNTTTSDGQQVSNFVRNALTPCFSQTVPYNISISTLNSIYGKMKSFVDTYNRNAEKIMMKTDLPNLGEEWVEVQETNMNKNPKKYKKYGSAKDEMLTCDTKNEVTTKKFFHIKEETHSAIINKNGVANTSVEACKTACREQVEVTYGPPKSVIAGQCFTYEVEIKSKVVCNTSINFDNFPKYEDYAPCLLKAHCNNLVRDEESHGGFDEQGGPNEDFDQCVSTCDGGKYTQSCINSCYDKVYNKKKTSTKKKATKEKVDNDFDDVKLYALGTLSLSKTTTNNTKAKKVVNSTDNFACPSIAHGSVSADDITAVYNYVNANITGNYSDSGATLTYNGNGNCEWDALGYAYFRDKKITARTVCNMKGLDWYTGEEHCTTMSHADCLANSQCYVGVKASGATYIAEGGFKVATNCGESCYWENTNKDANGRACHFTDRKKAEEAYKSSIESYAGAVTSCINQSSSCVENGETATFVMSANTDTKTGADNQTCDSNYGSNQNCLSWKKQPKKNILEDNRKAIDEKTLTDNTIIKFMGGSCATESSDWIYHTILTFPGAWINNKNGEISYNKQDERYYKHYTGNYCTPLNARNVNANWWLWNQYVKEGKTTKTFEQWATTSQSKKLVYNIFSQIRKFGLYEWSMDVGCFYAINNETVPPDTIPSDPEPSDPTPPPADCKNNDCIPKCSGSECSDTDVDTSFDNFTSKSISTTTMFPSSKQTSTSSTDKVGAKKLSYTDKLSSTQKLANSSPKRTEGYNWDVQATNLSVKGYPVTPSALVKKIENTETYDDNEIDYDITITPQNIRNIKAGNSNYTNFSGTYKTVENGYKDKYKQAGYSENSIPTYTYYVSNIIPRSGSNQYMSINKNRVPGKNGLPCNNLKDKNSCDITLGGYVTTDSELITFINSVNR